MFRCRVQQPDERFVGMLPLASLKRNECSFVLQQFYPRNMTCLLTWGPGKHHAVQIIMSPVYQSIRVFAFSGSRDGAANKQQFRVPQL